MPWSAAVVDLKMNVRRRCIAALAAQTDLLSFGYHVSLTDQCLSEMVIAGIIGGQNIWIIKRREIVVTNHDVGPKAGGDG